MHDLFLTSYNRPLSCFDLAAPVAAGCIGAQVAAAALHCNDNIVEAALHRSLAAAGDVPLKHMPLR